jgi:putative two-component system response regulator
MPPMSPVTSILIVDDEPAIRDIMSRWVTALGMEPKTAANADEALATMRRRHYDLAVIDVMMPGHDGLWLAAQLERNHPHTAVVIATAYTDLLDGDAADRPIADLLVKPFQRDRFTLAVDRGRQWRKEAIEGLRWHAMLSTELRERTAVICAEVQQRKDAGMTDLEALDAATVERAPETMLHSERVCRDAESMARELGLNEEDSRLLVVAARFHDVGKMAMPDALLTKPSPLTPGEMAIMRRHVDIGAEIIASTESLRDAAPLILGSHEWFDGGGYPQKLAGEAIPFASRIIAVVDAYDAMTQDRHYRSRLDSKDAIGELLRCCPTQFDPAVVAVFLTILGRQ